MQDAPLSCFRIGLPNTTGLEAQSKHALPQGKEEGIGYQVSRGGRRGVSRQAGRQTGDTAMTEDTSAIDE